MVKVIIRKLLALEHVQRKPSTSIFRSRKNQFVNPCFTPDFNTCLVTDQYASISHT